MTKRHALFFILISLIVGFITYIALENIYASIGVFGLYVIVGLFLISPMLKKSELVNRKYQECYMFKRHFLLAASTKGSLSLALESTLSNMPDDFVNQYNSLGQVTDKEKLEYLSTYFGFTEYQVFLQIVNLWIEKGGDILLLSKSFYNNLSVKEEMFSKFSDLNKKKYLEFGILWMMCFLMVILVKYLLKDFYSKIKDQLSFIICFLAICVFALLSIYLLVHVSTKEYIRRFEKDEKIA